MREAVLNGRTKALLRGAAGSGGAKAIGLGISLLAMPAYVAYFDDETLLGLWFALLVVLTWALSFDLGVGNGLRQFAVSCFATEDWAALRSYVASAYAAAGLGAVGVTVLAILVVISDDHDLAGRLLGVALADSEVLAVFIVFGAMLAQMFLRIIIALLYAAQRPVYASLFSLVSNSVLLLYLWASLLWGWPRSLIWLSIAYALAVNGPLVLGSIHLFRGEFARFMPSLGSVAWRPMREVIRTGLGFLGLQVGYMLLSTLNPLLIATVVNVSDVVTYTVLSRPYQAVVLLFSLLLTPVWSAVTLALVEGKREWVRRLTARLALVSGLLVLGLVVLSLSLQGVVDVWVGRGVATVTPIGTLALLGGFSLLVLMTGVSAISNGLGLIRSQFALMLAGLLLKIAFVFLIGKSRSWEWVALSDVFGFAPYVILQPILLRNYLRRESDSVVRSGP